MKYSSLLHRIKASDGRQNEIDDLQAITLQISALEDRIEELEMLLCIKQKKRINIYEKLVKELDAQVQHNPMSLFNYNKDFFDNAEMTNAEMVQVANYLIDWAIKHDTVPLYIWKNVANGKY